MVGKGPRFCVNPVPRSSLKSLEGLAVTNSTKKNPDRETKRLIKRRRLTNPPSRKATAWRAPRSPAGLSLIRSSESPERNRRLSRFVAHPLRGTKGPTSRRVIFVFIRVHGG